MIIVHDFALKKTLKNTCQHQTFQLCREVKSESGNCASHVDIDILGYKLMFRALYKTVLFSEFIYIALKHSFDLY